MTDQDAEMGPKARRALKLAQEINRLRGLISGADAARSRLVEAEAEFRQLLSEAKPQEGAGA